MLSFEQRMLGFVARSHLTCRTTAVDGLATGYGRIRWEGDRLLLVDIRMSPPSVCTRQLSHMPTGKLRMFQIVFVSNNALLPVQRPLHGYWW